MSSNVASTGSLARAEDISCTNEEIHLSSPRSKEHSFPPIHSLPSELLEVIFIHVVREYYYYSGWTEYPISCIPTWVNVSYVCRRWRDVALNCATLWTYHFSLSLRWMDELLLRSRQASLKISCINLASYISWWPAFLDNLLKHSERIQELSLQVMPSHLPNDFFLHVPRLEFLKIGSRFPFNGRLLFTDAGTPVLRRLQLLNCSLQWHLVNLTKLEELSVTLDPREPHDQFDVVGLLTSMHSMKNLAVIYLDHILLSDVMSRSDDYGASHKIDLPRLALFVIKERLPAVRYIFSCFEIPLKTHIHLYFGVNHDASAEDYAPLSSFLAQRFSTGEQSSTSGPVVRSLIMHISRWNASMTLSYSEWDCNPAPRLEYGNFHSAIPLQITLNTSKIDRDEAQRHPITTDICRSLPLTNVQTLYIEGQDMYPWDVARWRELFGCLDDLRYLKLKHSGMPNLSMLSLATPEPEANSDGQPGQGQDASLGRTLVPALEKVELSGIHFLPDDVPARDNWMSEKAFREVLSTRNIHGDQVIMNACEISKLYDCERDTDY